MSQDLDLTHSRRAVAAGWKWQAGALTVSGWRVCTIGANKAGAQVLEQADGEYWIPAAAELPDFTDAATRGVLLEQVRERCGEPLAHVTVHRWHGVNTWTAFIPTRATPCWLTFNAPSETAALVAALEAAPKEKGL